VRAALRNIAGGKTKTKNKTKTKKQKKRVPRKVLLEYHGKLLFEWSHFRILIPGPEQVE